MTRHEPQMGDVFAVRGRTVVGRVVSTSAVVGPTHGCLLVYVYADARCPSREALLVPPMLTTRAPWHSGLFEHVRREPLLPGQCFETHAFLDARGVVLDEEGRPLELFPGGAPIGTCRLWDVEAIRSALDAAARARVLRG